jgi:hypothetical protein
MQPEHEPALTTSPELAGILQDLIDREPVFHCPEWGTTRADFERMMSEEFWETGASGARYSRQFVLDELERRFASLHDDIWETTGYFCQQLAPDLYLLTYSLIQNHIRKSRRATIWRRTAEGWKIVYHQGTLIQEQTVIQDKP